LVHLYYFTTFIIIFFFKYVTKISRCVSWAGKYVKCPFYHFPLTYICNEILSSGVYPERLKYTIIKTVCKKGDKFLTTIYRLISLKKLIYSRLYKHICTNNIIVNEQYGFRINCSTESASYSATNEILKAVNNRQSV